jgi:ABC-2 type transport system permease protein
VRKFLILVGKEVRELITPQIILPMLAVIALFGLLGRIIWKQAQNAPSGDYLAVVDQDASELSRRVLDDLRDKTRGFRVSMMDAPPEELLGRRHWGNFVLLVIPKGFETDIESGRKARFRVYTVFRSLGARSMLSIAHAERAERSVDESLARVVVESALPDLDADFVTHPADPEEYVAVGDSVRKVPIAQVLGFLQSQTFLFPVVIFLAIMFSAQLVSMSVVSEKENKTLEILLSSPIGRKTLVFAKLAASAAVAFGFTAAYMAGMRSFMSAVTGGMVASPQSETLRTAMEGLGLVISPWGYAMIGLSVLFAILCALSVAILLGILAEDVKTAHMAATPLLLVLMLSYMLPLFVDLQSASRGLKVLLAVIPFTHAFLAPQNVVLGRTAWVWGGIAYQAAVFFAFVALASRIFSKELVMTIRLRLILKRRDWNP